MIEFRYANRGPVYAVGWGDEAKNETLIRTNVIRLRWDGVLVYSRHYVRDDGTFDETGIVHRFEPNVTAEDVARQIHWGCCGWAAGMHQIWQLRDKVAEFLKPANV